MIGNTLTRQCDGFHQVYTFSHDELNDAYMTTLCNDFPCPSFLWRRILQIGDLRAEADSGMPGAVLWQKAKLLYEAIQEFAPDAWEEPYPIPAAETAYLVAAIFKVALSIYSYSCYPVTSDSTLPEWTEVVKATHRTNLLRLINQAFERDKIRWCLTWPLAVLGYAVDSGSFSERALVDRLLADMGSEYSPMPPRVRMRLQRFWKSKRKTWDECWYEPTIFTI